jgi:uncharacterized membrane protein YhiD involved in acid resistance
MQLLFAALLGAVLGLQREFGYILRPQKWAHGMAGLRTHINVAVAAALFTIISQHGAAAGAARRARRARTKIAQGWPKLRDLARHFG